MKPEDYNRVSNPHTVIILGFCPTYKFHKASDREKVKSWFTTDFPVWANNICKTEHPIQIHDKYHLSFVELESSSTAKEENISFPSGRNFTMKNKEGFMAMFHSVIMPGDFHEWITTLKDKIKNYFTPREAGVFKGPFEIEYHILVCVEVGEYE